MEEQVQLRETTLEEFHKLFPVLADRFPYKAVVTFNADILRVIPQRGRGGQPGGLQVVLRFPDGTIRKTLITEHYLRKRKVMGQIWRSLVNRRVVTSAVVRLYPSEGQIHSVFPTYRLKDVPRPVAYFRGFVAEAEADHVKLEIRYKKGRRKVRFYFQIGTGFLVDKPEAGKFYEFECLGWPGPFEAFQMRPFNPTSG